MTAIERLLVHTIDIPLVRPFVTAVRRTESITAVLVEATDSDGRSGWGEAATSWRVTGESASSVTAAVEGPLASAVLGRDCTGDARQFGDLLAGAVIHNTAARSAVECALYDLTAQQAGLPLWQYLGGRANTVTSDMTLSAGDPDELVTLALAYCAQGFRTLKLKVGAGFQDWRAVAAVREAVGEKVALRVDANQAWSAQEAVDIIRGWENSGLNIELIEQPVPARALDELAYVSRHVETPILADESVWNTDDLKDVVKRRAANMVNIKLAKTAGLTEAARMIEYATEHGVDVVIGCMMESQVGITAAAALASTLGNATPAHDLDAGMWLTASPVIGAAQYDADALVLSNAGGNGITGLAGTRSIGGDR